MTPSHVTNIPWPDRASELQRLSSSDPASVYYVQVLPRGHDAEVDRLRAAGLVQVFRCPRPVRVREVDKVAHKLIRKG